MDNSLLQKEMHKMIFLYNCIMEGWTVKKLDNNKFEFTQKINNDNHKKEILSETHIKNFIESNLNIDNILNKNILNKNQNKNI